MHAKGKGSEMYLLSLFLLFNGLVVAQPGTYDPDKVNKKAHELYEKAMDPGEQW